MAAVLGLIIGVVVGLFVRPDIPIFLQPYLPIMVVAALDAGPLRQGIEGVPILVRHVQPPVPAQGVGLEENGPACQRLGNPPVHFPGVRHGQRTHTATAAA